MVNVIDVLSKYFDRSNAEKILEVLRIEKLYPTQEAAIKSGLLDGKASY
jgi:hypothetical protein